MVANYQSLLSLILSQTLREEQLGTLNWNTLYTVLNGRYVTQLCDTHTYAAVLPDHFTGTCQMQSELFIPHLNVGLEAVRFQKRQKRHILSLAVAWFLQQRQCLVNSLIQIKTISVLWYITVLWIFVLASSAQVEI